MKEAPRAWYDRLCKFLLENRFQRGQVNKNLFIKKNDIIFGATNESLCNEFSEIMHNEFEMSIMGKLKYFLGLQIHQTENGTFINQVKYYKEIVAIFDMEKSKIIATTMSTSCYLDKNAEGKPVDERKYKCIIGFILYLTVSRLDIMFVVCMCARFQAS